MRRARALQVLRIPALLVVLAACGPSPATVQPAPTGTLVIVIRQGPERVSFQPKVDRIRRANEQLATILGHSIQIELDGSLLPQDHEGAQDVMARLIETVAQDLDAMKRQSSGQSSGRSSRTSSSASSSDLLVFSADRFERLVVRYSPTEAASRGRRRAVLDGKTIDVALGEARGLVLERGDVAGPLLRAWDAEHASPPGPGDVVGSVDTRKVRAALEAGDRKYLVEHAFADFSSTYHHHQAEVENARADSPFRKTESAYVAWVEATLPSMTVEERAHVARGLWVFDFRKNGAGERDPFASFAFPNLDKMTFGFAQIDAWIAAGHPSRVRVYDDVLNPVRVETSHGDLRYQGEGSHQPPFYRWALATPGREDQFTRSLLLRTDPRLLATAFYNAKSAVGDEASYLRFLRRFESSPAHWRAGADVLRAETFRPSVDLLDESRRQWREVPAARGYAFFYFARQADGSYHPEVDWPDFVQDVKPDDAVLKQTLALGWSAYELAPVFWRQLQKTSTRLGIMESVALELLAEDVHVSPGHRDVGGVLAEIGHQDCEDDDRAEVAALRQWAEQEIPKHPGQGLSRILERTAPEECKPKKRPVPALKAAPKKPARPKWKEGDPLPPKERF